MPVIVNRLMTSWDVTDLERSDWLWGRVWYLEKSDWLWGKGVVRMGHYGDMSDSYKESLDSPRVGEVYWCACFSCR